ncbi:carboxylate-amine ligase [Actinoplanes octamycinicus]|uniref:Putative glutamate--cysteine ligase 2 n=1 Tax=Actinoplanes octamycinicus TaxID=135948 RepID=A0A7W7GXF1_9ACTN|nr:YbdK family carboxylate-amine ligase [Actinoplanes octamycinicus]MBB4740105.1 carboxylate-amine ligase [Actinoplanes octamycinicus]GIE59502.1 putative glutamate--cysteine ligase 2 [Actinoplanes octamycinicus]
MLTIGVEEEFLLLEADGAVAPVAPSVVRQARVPGQIKPEYMAYQLETSSRVCHDLDELRRDLTRLRMIAVDAAERTGVHLVATGVVPLNGGPRQALSDDERYRELARRFPDASSAGGMCGCHVHVGVPDRELAAAVLTRLRPWLPALLALTVNSPFAVAEDTGWASSRYPAQLRWPSFRPPGVWAGAEHYDRAVRQHVEAGTALDVAGVYLMARLSPRYPTIEVRIGDTCLDVGDAVLLAGVIRALIGALLDDVRRNEKVVPASDAWLDAHLELAARGRLGHTDRLLAKITEYLDEDLGTVYTEIERQRREGTGADRQRRLWARHGGGEPFVRGLARATTPLAMAY